MLFLEWYEDSPKKAVAQRLTEARAAYTARFHAVCHVDPRQRGRRGCGAGGVRGEGGGAGAEGLLSGGTNRSVRKGTTMMYIKVAYLTLWFHCHPFTGDAQGRGVYPTWRTAYAVARTFA
jgi:hypothetical protein